MNKNTNAKKILVIEDNQEVRENICEILDLAGYQTVSAENGKKGIEYAVSEKPDLILCDVMMPELDGFGVLKILHKNVHTNHIPFVYLTAKTEQSDLRKGMGLGADDYILKPFDDTELLEAIEIRLEKYTSQYKNNHTSIKQYSTDIQSNLNEYIVELLHSSTEKRNYSPGSLIYKKETRPSWLFYVASGQIKTFIENDYGKELITHVLGPGELLGYHAIVSKGNYTHNASALSEVTLSLINADLLTEKLISDPSFSNIFIQYIVNQQVRLENKLIEFAYSSVRRKTAQCLLKLTEHSDTIHMSREDLAAYSGMAKETLIRTISDLRADQLIQTDGSEIRLLNRKKLNTLS